VGRDDRRFSLSAADLKDEERLLNVVELALKKLGALTRRVTPTARR
jgi:hypothetical protein